MKLSGDTKVWSKLLAVGLVTLVVAIRLLPHPPNFTPVAAIALFSGVYFKEKYWLVLPLGAMLLSDLYIGFAEFWVSFSVYFCFAVIYLIGYFLKERRNFVNIFLGTISGSIVFFLVTNFAVWAATGWYNKSWDGFARC